MKDLTPIKDLRRPKGHLFCPNGCVASLLCRHTRGRGPLHPGPPVALLRGSRRRRDTLDFAHQSAGGGGRGRHTGFHYRHTEPKDYASCIGRPPVPPTAQETHLQRSSDKHDIRLRCSGSSVLGSTELRPPFLDRLCVDVDKPRPLEPGSCGSDDHLCRGVFVDAPGARHRTRGSEGRLGCRSKGCEEEGGRY